MRKFPNGSVRDSLGEKPMLELIPYDLFYKRVGKLFTNGAKKYGTNNYRKGQPISSTIGSLQRHLAQYLMGDESEDHASAIVFNALSILNADEYFKDDPFVNDIQDWFENGKPTGKGNYEDKQSDVEAVEYQSNTSRIEEVLGEKIQVSIYTNNY